MVVSYLEVFTLIAIVHCFVLSLVILFSKFLRSSTNRYLGITLIVISIIGINNWFWDFNKNPVIIQFLDFFLWQFLYPVTLLLFFYKANKSFIHKRTKVLFFLPFVVLTICNIIVSLENIYGLYKLPFITKDSVSFFYKAISLCSIIFPFIVLLPSFWLLFVKTQKSTIKWLRVFWVIFALIEVYGFLLEFHRFLYLERKSLNYLWIGVSLLMYWVIYIGIYRFKLSNDQYEIREYLKTKKVNATNELIENPIIKEFIRLLSDEHIHRSSQLNRDFVAEKLGISPGYLSQLIKESPYKSFSDIVNKYRVEDVKEMLIDPDFSNYSLLAIGLEVGFNSKATFFNAFKKYTGITPSEYQKQHK